MTPAIMRKTGKSHLGEFVITNGSGWMYSVNNVFPNVGFADTYLSTEISSEYSSLSATERI